MRCADYGARVDHLTVFASHVFVFRNPDSQRLNARLLPLLLAESQATPGLQVSNHGGWHSPPDLCQRPPFQELMGLFVSRVGSVVRTLSGARDLPVPELRFGVQSWAMVMPTGAFTRPHDHATSPFSLVWYVDGGEPGQGGELVLMDPRRAAPSIPGLPLDPRELTIRPETGMLVVFPGSLQHWVQPYRGQRPRVSISANVGVEVQRA